MLAKEMYMLDRVEVLIAFDGEGGRPGDGEMGVWVRGFGFEMEWEKSCSQ